MAVWSNRLPGTAAVWFGDSTAEADRLASLLGYDVFDMTPDHRVEMVHKAVQITRDVTRGISPKSIKAILRSVLIDRPACQSVGVICHGPHVSHIERLESPFRERIVKVSYFGSGEDRSSNEWCGLCDLLIVAGTPRVSPQVIKTRLVQVGEYEAASRDAQWGEFRWLGRTESGEERIVTGRGYADPAWRQAHGELVRAAIVQAVGRGRGVMETGCEVIVLSNEECGLRLSDRNDLKPMGATEAKALVLVTELSLQNVKNILGKGSDNLGISTGEISRRISVNVSRARKLLVSLEHRGLIRRVGSRKGWLPVMR